MSKQDDNQEPTDHLPESEVAEGAEFQSEAVATFVEAVRDAWKQARKDKKLAKADLVEVLAPQLAELDRTVSESTAELRGKVSDLAKLAQRQAQDVNELMGRLRREDAVAKAKEEFAKAMLGVVDAVDQAQSLLKDADPSVLQGIEMTSKLIDHAFSSQGFTKLNPMHIPFDPKKHEGMGTAESEDHPEGTIIELVQSGYFNESTGNVVRAPRVIYATKPSVDAETDDESETTDVDPEVCATSVDDSVVGESEPTDGESDMTNDDATNTTDQQTKPANE